MASYRINVVAPTNADYLVVHPARVLAERGNKVVRYMSRDELMADKAGLAATDVLVAWPQVKIDRAVMEAAPKLRAIVGPTTGTDGFDETSATELGIVVANGQVPENYLAMAESTVLLILAALYDLPYAERSLRQNLPRPKPHDLRGRMLRGLTVGFVGFGLIAQAVAERLAAWQCKMLVYVRSPRDLPPYVTAAPLDDVLRQSDVVSVLIGLNPTSRKLLDAAKLRLMKPDVVFVNTARGGVIDEAALIALAAERPQMRLALDVFEVEPLPPTSPLRDIPHAILTPHMIGHTVSAHEVLPRVVVENVEATLALKPPPYFRNPQVLERWRARFSA